MNHKLKTMLVLLLTLFLGLTFFNPLLAKKKHPKVSDEMIGEDPLICSQCHENQYKTWEKGLHGLNQVRCFICHGDLEKRFEKVASPNNCVMCHADKVEDLKMAKKPNCFVCHVGHTLEVKPGSKSIHQK